jgi:hypothetical protein
MRKQLTRTLAVPATVLAAGAAQAVCSCCDICSGCCG